MGGGGGGAKKRVALGSVLKKKGKTFLKLWRKKIKGSTTRGGETSCIPPE